MWLHAPIPPPPPRLAASLFSPGRRGSGPQPAPHPAPDGTAAAELSKGVGPAGPVGPTQARPSHRRKRGKAGAEGRAGEGRSGAWSCEREVQAAVQADATGPGSGRGPGVGGRTWAASGAGCPVRSVVLGQDVRGGGHPCATAQSRRPRPDPVPGPRRGGVSRNRRRGDARALGCASFACAGRVRHV